MKNNKVMRKGWNDPERGEAPENGTELTEFVPSEPSSSSSRNLRIRRRRLVRRLRRGMTALEVVMASAIVIPPLAFMAYQGIRALRVLFTLIGSMVGSPLL